MRRWQREALERRKNELNNYLYKPKLTKKDIKKANELIDIITSYMVRELRDSLPKPY